MRESFLAAKPWGPVPEAPRGFSWEGLMELALDMARKGAEQGEVPVGAVICDLQGTILAKAHNLSIQNCDPTAHAGAVCSCYEGLNCPELGVGTWHYGGLMADASIAVLQKFFKEKR